LAESSEREEERMSIPNIGPEHSEPSEPDDVRVGNAALVYRDPVDTDDVRAASTRASTVTHRFGGVRYALSRPERAPEPEQADESGESDESR
jgi:hypothetical protein